MGASRGIWKSCGGTISQSRRIPTADVSSTVIDRRGTAARLTGCGASPDEGRRLAMEGGGGGPAPFLLKTYEMVEDSSTDDIVSWSAAKNSFVVWKPPEFASILLPSYFKHNNFSSFIRQLNTYGFRKIDPERWEFANEEFVKGQKHLLKNIHRRKPIYSHSHPPGGAANDSDRASLEEEIDQLTREKTALESNLYRFKQQQSGSKLQLEDLDRRVQDMEGRQQNMMTFLARAVHNPAFVEHLVQMAGAVPVDSLEIHKKRRLPGDAEGGAEGSQEVPEDNFHGSHDNSNLKPQVCPLFHQDFSNKLKLELCSAMSDSNLLSPSTQSSNDDGFGTPRRRRVEGGVQLRPDCPSVLPERLELLDTGASCCPRKNTLFQWQVRNAEEGDSFMSCHLNLTLASSPLQLDSTLSSAGIQSSGSHETGNTVDLRKSNTHKEDDFGKVTEKPQNSTANGSASISPLHEDNPSTSQTTAPAVAGRVNDKFWENFLTERPGSSDTEEASSSLKTDSSAEQQEVKNPQGEKLWRSRKDIEQLTL